MLKGLTRGALKSATISGRLALCALALAFLGCSASEGMEAKPAGQTGDIVPVEPPPTSKTRAASSKASSPADRCLLVLAIGRDEVGYWENHIVKFNEIGLDVQLLDLAAEESRALADMGSGSGAIDAALSEFDSIREEQRYRRVYVAGSGPAAGAALAVAAQRRRAGGLVLLSPSRYPEAGDSLDDWVERVRCPILVLCSEQEGHRLSPAWTSESRSRSRQVFDKVLATGEGRSGLDLLRDYGSQETQERWKAIEEFLRSPSFGAAAGTLE